MKTLLFLSIILCLLSCESEKDKLYNFDMKRTISLHLANWKADHVYKDSVHYVFDRKTFEELRAEENKFTFSQWYAPGDTIWFYKRIPDGRGHLISQCYVIHSDSCYVVMVNHGVMYKCPEY